ncbi:MAG: hypothetical protein ACPHJD_05395 [Poseidonia sp.]
MQEDPRLRSLNHGVLHIPRPSTLHKFGYLVSSILFAVALFLYSSSLSIPDIPRLDEATEMDSLPGDLSSLSYLPTEKGYDSTEYASSAAFIIVPLELERGLVATDSCRWVEDDEGGGSWQYEMNTADARPLVLRDANGVAVNAAFSMEGSLRPEVDLLEVECNSDWSRDIDGGGLGEDNFVFAAFMLIEQEPARYQLLSMGEIQGFENVNNGPDEVTQREDRGRWALLASGFGGLLFMLSTSPSLKDDLRRIRTENRSLSKDVKSAAGVLGTSGRYFQHLGPNFEVFKSSNYPARMAKDDWLFGAPPLPEAYTNPFQEDEGGMLMPEHPNRMGTPNPGTITPYSLGAIVFSGSFIWLSADLRARDGSAEHVALGWGLTLLVTVVNFVWFFLAWKQFKLVRLVNDLPSSPIRSVAIGQAEIVGQVRPSIAGTPVMEVGGRKHEGLAYWQWDSYYYECHTDSDGDRQCSWKHVETKRGGVPFIVHDGTGGMIVDPERWKDSKIDVGPKLEEWQRGDWKWTVAGFGIGDPIYILGDCVSRTEQDKQDWGSDPVLANALVTMVPSAHTGDPSVIHYGTEIDLLSKNRSIFEIFIVPLLVFLFGVFMFLNYTP